MADIDERLAVAVAVKKMAIDAEAKAKAEIEARYRADGIKSRDAMVGGRKVGTVTVRNLDGPAVADERAFRDWACSVLPPEQVVPQWKMSLDGMTREERIAVARFAESLHPGCVDEWLEPTAEARKALLKGLREGPGGVCVTPDGEVAGGVRWKTGLTVSARMDEPRDVQDALRLAYGIDAAALLGGGE